MANTRKAGSRAANSRLNGEWGQHVRRWMKRLTSKIRRAEGKRQSNAER